MKLGLYVHIPFCHSKCYYCDFLSFPNKGSEADYIEALIKEIEHYGEQVRGVHTISSLFIGGGTPTVLSPFLCATLCDAIRKNFDLEEDYEWTVEANPGTITPEHVKVFKAHGINRVSLGLQAKQEHLLKAIGRIHTFADWEKSVLYLREQGIYNINTDIMFALPGQTLEDFSETVEAMIDYEIPHVSAYSLIVEEGTLFGKWHDEGRLKLSDEVLDRQMYEQVMVRLKQAGYDQYEISNWAKDGKVCKHNIVYWKCRPYIGIGLGAHGFMNHIRYHNTEQFNDYLISQRDLKQLVVEQEKLTIQMEMEEFMFLGLRMLEGISKEKFEDKFNILLDEIYGQTIRKWIQSGHMKDENGKVALTLEGISVSNQIFADFLID